MPRIIEDDLFYRVQDIMNKNKSAKARARGEGEYLLTTKLFCGHCKDLMVGYAGTSKSKKLYHYYACKQVRKKAAFKGEDNQTDGGSQFANPRSTSREARHPIRSKVFC